MAAPIASSLSDIARILNLNKDDFQALDDEVKDYFTTSDDELQESDADEDSDFNLGE